MLECEQSANKVTSHLTVSSTVIMGPFTGSRGLKQSVCFGANTSLTGHFKNQLLLLQERCFLKWKAQYLLLSVNVQFQQNKIK